MSIKYFALRTFTIGATTYNYLDSVDTTGMSNDVLSGLSALGWVGTTVGGNVGNITVSDEEPVAPSLNDLWIDTN